MAEKLLSQHEINEIGANVKYRIETDIKAVISDECDRISHNLIEWKTYLKIDDILNKAIDEALKNVNMKIDSRIDRVIEKHIKKLEDRITKKEVLDSISSNEDFLSSIVERINNLQITRS